MVLGDKLPESVWVAAGPSPVALADTLLGTKSPQARAYLRLAGGVIARGDGYPRTMIALHFIRCNQQILRSNGNGLTLVDRSIDPRTPAL